MMQSTSCRLTPRIPLRGFPGLFTDTAELIRFFFAFSFFPTFSYWFRAVHQADLCQLLSAH